MALIDQAYLEDHVGTSAILLSYAKQNADNITNAIAAFHGKFKSDALRAGYSEASIDALTVATAPMFWKSVGAQYALGTMTSGDGNRPDNIEKGWLYANEQLKLLATSNHTVSELDKSTIDRVRVGSVTAISDNRMDRDNTETSSGIRRVGVVDPWI